MKIWIVSWQQGFGIAWDTYLQQKNAESRYNELKEKFKNLQADSTTAVNYNILDSLNLIETETKDEIDKKSPCFRCWDADQLCPCDAAIKYNNEKSEAGDDE